MINTSESSQINTLLIDYPGKPSCINNYVLIAFFINTFIIGLDLVTHNHIIKVL